MGYVAAQIDLSDFDPEEDHTFNIGDYWTSTFTQWFPSHCKWLYEDVLHALFVGVPTDIVESIPGVRIAPVEIPSIASLWADLTEYMANVELDIDVSKLIKLNYYARFLLASVEA